jgi:CheY-like chemotaxis protein
MRDSRTRQVRLHSTANEYSRGGACATLGGYAAEGLNMPENSSSQNGGGDEAARPAAPEAGKWPGRPARVLIVDEDERIHDQAKTVLLALGYEVVCVANVADALRHCARSMPDLLLTAVVLPDSSGLELASQLRKVSANLAVVYMSGASDPIRIGGPLHAASSSVRKPFGADQLAGEVVRLRPPRARESAGNSSL